MKLYVTYNPFNVSATMCRHGGQGGKLTLVITCILNPDACPDAPLHYDKTSSWSMQSIFNKLCEIL